MSKVDELSELWQARTRSTQWVLKHLTKKNLEDLQYHIKQINLIAKNSGLWDFQRTGIFKQTMDFEEVVRKAVEANAYDTTIQKSLVKERKNKK